MNLTLVGTVLQGTNTYQTLSQGLNFISLAVPIDSSAANIVGPTYGLPLNMTSTNLASDVNGGYPDPQLNDTLYVWNGHTFNGWYYFNASDANDWNGTPTAGFYDTGGDLLGSPGNPGPTLSQGFFLYHTTNSFNRGSITWTNSFTVQ